MQFSLDHHKMNTIEQKKNVYPVHCMCAHIALHLHHHNQLEMISLTDFADTLDGSHYGMVLIRICWVSHFDKRRESTMHKSILCLLILVFAKEKKRKEKMNVEKCLREMTHRVA